MREPVQRGAEGKHRNLHHVKPLAMRADLAERLGVNQILRVVLHNDLVAAARGGFVPAQSVVDGIQAVGLGGGAWLGTNHVADTWEALLGRCNALDRGRIVRIDSQPDFVVVILDRRQVGIEHVLDDAGFLPARHEDGNARLSIGSLGRAGRGLGCASGGGTGGRSTARPEARP